MYFAGNYDDAAIVLDKAIAGCRDDEVAEIRSLGNTLASWRTEIRLFGFQCGVAARSDQSGLPA